MKCPNCGFEANGKFCENCGSPLAQNSSRKNTEGVNSFEQDNHNAVPEQQKNRRYNNKRYQRYNYTYNSCHSYFDLQFTAKVYGYGE